MSTTLPVLLFAIIFLWTPPHFWALSLFVRTDYADAGVPMLPVVAGRREHPPPDPALHPADGRRRGRALGAGPDRLDLWRRLRSALNAVFLVLALAVLANKATEPKAMGPEKRLFAFSILYLFGLFAALVVDRWLLA